MPDGSEGGESKLLNVLKQLKDIKIALLAVAGLSGGTLGGNLGVTKIIDKLDQHQQHVNGKFDDLSESIDKLLDQVESFDRSSQKRYTALEKKSADLVMPPGTILPYASKSGVNNVPTGWVLCGTTETSPKMAGRFLVGLRPDQVEQAGDPVGAVGDSDNGTFETDSEVLDPEKVLSGKDTNKGAGRGNRVHKHGVTLPAVKVLFLCKQ